jgi:hypothetical protein
MHREVLIQLPYDHYQGTPPSINVSVYNQWVLTIDTNIKMKKMHTVAFENRKNLTFQGQASHFLTLAG